MRSFPTIVDVYVSMNQRLGLGLKIIWIQVWLFQTSILYSNEMC
jgi:hypothetical protein